MGQKVVNVQSAVDLKRQKERQTYLVVVRTKMCDIASLEGHGHRRVDERGRDEEVDDPVFTYDNEFTPAQCADLEQQGLTGW